MHDLETIIRLNAEAQAKHDARPNNGGYLFTETPHPATQKGAVHMEGSSETGTELGKSVFTLYIGGQYDRYGIDIPSADSQSVLMDGMREATHAFGGTTMLFGWGMWKNTKGETIMEKSARIEIVTASYRRGEVYDIAIQIRKGLNSSEVLVTETYLPVVKSIKAPEERAVENG